MTKLRIKKKLYKEYLSDLLYEVSLDPVWRKKLFAASTGERFRLFTEDLERLEDKLKFVIRKFNLKFTVFNDGWTEFGHAVFGFSCVEFPKLIVYSTNNPQVL